ncbi:MAG: gliding motility-associated C-terminal domain-containing protein, partial [Thermoanaerobaculia bacterium]|nr:gliding motility-associated C-terminal domain-containing protein [Thermoanaerobaculia bacterium]
IQNLDNPLVFIQTSRDTMCPGETATLLALSTEPGSFRWSDNSINTLYTAIPPVDGENMYSVTFTATDNGCTASASKSIFRITAPEVSCPDYTVTVENGGRQSLGCNAGNDELIWVASAVNVKDIPALGSGMVTDQLFTLVQARAPGSVQYSFYAKNAGCTSDRTDVLVEVAPKSSDGIFIPELITPDGNGMNDTWDIILPDQIQNPEAYTLTLFSRNGSQVYQGTLAMTFRASEYPDGVYYYVLTKPDGEKLNGAVTILRRQ